MKASLQDRLRELTERYEEIAHLLSDPGVIADKNKFRELSREYARLEPGILARKLAEFVLVRDDARIAQKVGNLLVALGELSEPVL